jgi:hypothetical protein
MSNGKLHFGGGGLLHEFATDPTDITQLQSDVADLQQAVLLPSGGFAVWLENQTGAASVKGTLVEASSTVDNAFQAITANDPDPIGAVFDDGVANGEQCRVVVGGRAQVLLEDGTATSRGYWAKVSETANGRVDATLAAPSGGTIAQINEHFHEVGHTLEAKTAGTNVLCWIIMHFN